jgi:parallel beta-helix repeat protein
MAWLLFWRVVLKEFTPFPGAVITQSVRFVCSEYDFSGKQGITIAEDDIEIEGNGAVIRGGMTHAIPIHVKDAADSTVPAEAVCAESKYFGTGIRIVGRSGIIMRNITISGFDLGIQIDHCENVILEKCNVSGCFHDPDWGWDERGNHGGILLIGSNKCVIRSCRANQVWDALHLQYSDNNLLEGNDFSRTSNTGLKMWRSCGNRILNNDLSWGIRISPGEVHARDSSCVLVEAGSNDNVFRNNDMTHGGDGFFIRVLNSWMSTGNVLENNDCSYANNNGIEAWADCNTYIRNKANHCSYGFWLGNSNHTVLLENEAAYNGSDFHNAPEAFGNAGIAFVNGSCSHSTIKGNQIHHNTGPGIAIRNSRDNPSLHMLISNNRIEHNRSKGTFFGHGIYLKHTRLVLLQSNIFSGNEGEELFADGEDNDIYTQDNEQKYGNTKNLTVNPEQGIILAGKPVRFRVDAGLGSVHWDFGDGSFAAAIQPEHVYSTHGMFPLSVTSADEQGVRLAGRAIHVLPGSFQPFETEKAECPEGTLAFLPGIYGLDVPHASWGMGTERRLWLHGLRRRIADDSVLVLQLQYTGDQKPDWEKSRLFPVVTLFSSPKNYLVLKPEKPLISMETALFSEYRGSGCILLFPLSSRPGFLVSKHGEGIDGGVREIEIDCGASDAVQSSLIVNALGFATVRDDLPVMPDLIPGNLEKAIPFKNAITYRENHDTDSKEGIAFREHIVKKWETTDAAGVLFRSSIVIDKAQVVMRPRLIGGYQQAESVAFALLPLESLSAGMWEPVVLHTASSYSNGICTYRFGPIHSEGLRLAGIHNGMRDGIARFSAFFTNSVQSLRISTKTGRIRIDSISMMLNKEPSLDNKL